MCETGGEVLCAPCFGQGLGTITGEIKDSTGAVLPGASVTVVNKATNATRTTVTNGVGLFDLPRAVRAAEAVPGGC